jgi:hypothetical protein
MAVPLLRTEDLDVQRRSRWRRGVAGVAAASICAAAVVLLAGGGRGGGARAPSAGNRVVLMDGVNEAEWGVQQAFATFAHNNDEEHPAVQQAYEFSANETARRRARVCEFIGDMGDVLEEMSTERAIEMIRRLSEVESDGAWDEMKQKLLTTPAKEGGEGGNATAAEGNTTTTAEAKPLTPREQLLVKFGCDLVLKRLPGFWGQWYFIGTMPAPLNAMSAAGPTTDVAKMVPNVTKVSETIDFEDQEAVNGVSEKIPPGAFAVKWTGEVLIKKAGTYTFYTSSFDGSRVFVDGELVVDNSGYHARQTRSGEVKLWEGYHTVVLDYFLGEDERSFGNACVIAQYSGPDTAGQVAVLQGTHDAVILPKFKLFVIMIYIRTYRM